MRNQRTWAIFFLSLLISAVISFNAPIVGGTKELISLALSVTSILFGLLSGFFLTQMWNKYTSIREHSASMKSGMLSMIRNFYRIDAGKELTEEFEREAEKALIAFILTSWKEMSYEDKYFDKFFRTIDNIPVNDQKSANIYSNLLEAQGKVQEARVRLTTLGKESLAPIEWAILFILSGVITISVFLLRDGSLFFNSLATILPPLVVLTLLTLDDLDDLRWGKQIVSFEPAQSALESINCLRFYEKRFVKSNWIEVPEKHYYRTEEELTGELRDIYLELKEKEALRKKEILGPKF